MNDHVRQRALWSIPGEGVLAREGDLVLLSSIDDRGFLERLLELLTGTERAGGDGRQFADAIGQAVESDQSWAAGTLEQQPAVIGFGPAGAGLAVTVTGTAWLEITTEHGTHRLAAGQPSAVLRCVLGIPVQALRGGIGTGRGDGGQRTDRFSRLDRGTMRAGGLSYYAAQSAGPAGLAAEPATAEPSAAEPTTAEPAVAEPPGMAGPVPAEPAPPEPASIPPAAAAAPPEPAAAEPASAVPASAEPAAGQPAAAAGAPGAAAAAAALAGAVAAGAGEAAAGEQAAGAGPGTAEPAAAEPAPPPGPPARPKTELAATPDLAAASDLAAGRPRQRTEAAWSAPSGEQEAAAEAETAGQPGTAAEPGLTDAAGAPIVMGVYCQHGHFNDPDAIACAQCGNALNRHSRVTRPGPRPPLGVLVLDDDRTFQLDGDFVVGRDPMLAEPVVAGQAKPLWIVDAESTVSRVHARIHLDGWQVLMTDLGSANGTRIQPPGTDDEQPLDPQVPVPLQGGTRIFVGAAGFWFHSPGGR